MTTNAKDLRILIVGAGITGSALYRALQQQGIKASIIEKSPTLVGEGGSLCLPANAMLELQKLGLDRAVLDAAHQVHAIEYALSDGTTLAKASLDQPPLAQAPFVALARPALLDILRQGHGDSIQLNTQLQALHNTAQGVEVTFSSGEQQHFDLVIAADGLHSRVRHLAFTGGSQTLGVTHWRFNAHMNTGCSHPIYYVGDNTAWMIYPLGDNQVYCYAQVLDSAQHWHGQAPHTALRTLFKDYCQPVQQLLQQLDSATNIRLGELESVSEVVAVQQRVVLLGDALHGCPPTLQQGAALGLEDANCLAALLATHSVEQALNNFEQARLARVRSVVKESNKIVKLAGLGRYWLGRVVRNAIIRSGGPANVVQWRKLLSSKPY